MVAFDLCRPLRGFDLVKDRDTGNSKGYGFCVYQVSEFKHYIHLVSVSTAKSYYVLI